MSISDLYKKSRISSRLVEEELYAEALRELEQGIRRDGLWAKAFAKSEGNEEKAKALYIELRVQAYRDELALYEMQLEEKKREHTQSEQNIKGEGKDQNNSAEKMQAREESIKLILRKKLGREPTAIEIEKAKWEGMCL